MNKIAKFLLGIVLALAPIRISHGVEPRYTPTVKKTIDSVVKITCFYLIPVSDGKKGIKFVPQTSVGAGVIISTNGHILTCQHVVSGHPLVIDVRLHGSTSTYIGATVLRRDFSRDLALLKLKSSTTTYSVSLATESPEVGEEVIAIGHPYLYEWSVTAGIVSGLNREGLAVHLLQMDAPINPGNSGGPLFNLEGKIVGLNESGIRGANCMGFAVPVEEIRTFLSIFKGLEQVY